MYKELSFVDWHTAMSQGQTVVIALCVFFTAVDNSQPIGTCMCKSISCTIQLSISSVCIQDFKYLEKVHNDLHATFLNDAHGMRFVLC